MSISIIAIALAAQAAGQEITTFHPLPSQKKEEQEQAQPKQGAPDRPAGAAPEEARPAPPPAEPEKIEVLSVRKVARDVSVKFVPPEGEEEPE